MKKKKKKNENINLEFARKIKKHIYVDVLIVMHKVHKTVLNFIKWAKVDFQK